jgi:hypothetical protein
MDGCDGGRLRDGQTAGDGTYINFARIWANSLFLLTKFPILTSLPFRMVKPQRAHFCAPSGNLGTQRWKSEAPHFAVFFPVIRENGAENSSQATASAATQSIVIYLVERIGRNCHVSAHFLHMLPGCTDSLVPSERSNSALFAALWPDDFARLFLARWQRERPAGKSRGLSWTGLLVFGFPALTLGVMLILDILHR